MIGPWLDAEVLLKRTNDSKFENSSNQKVELGSSNAAKVVQILKKLNFEVLAVSDYSISIKGYKETFQKAFDIKSIDLNDSILIPKILKDYVEGIYIQTPPTLF